MIVPWIDPLVFVAWANAAGVGNVAVPRINVARARMLVAPAFRKQLFFERCESKENSS
jgi:hypothetical protein